MIIFPAIDLKDGVCVRLKKGVMEDATVFNTDPGAQAKEFAAQGFQWLHCVDLNGAFAGHSANTDAIKAIRTPVIGATTRWTACSFMAESRSDDAVLCWG